MSILTIGPFLRLISFLFTGFGIIICLVFGGNYL